MSDNKLNNIEETLAHHEQQINDLSDIVTRQWDEIDVLKKRISKMHGKIGALECGDNFPDGEGASISDIAAQNKPPHY